MFGLLVLFWISLVRALAFSNATCPENCSCEDTSVVCSAQGVFQLPTEYPPDITYLDFQSNSISEVKSKTFSHLPNLKDLYLSDNLIQTLQPQAFAGLGNLQSLHLEKNKLERLPAGVFAGIRVVKLILDDNPIQEIIPGAFTNSSVEELWLRRCDLRILSEDSLKDLRLSLKELYIADNLHPLEWLPETFLEGFFMRLLFLENIGLKNTDFLKRTQVNTLQLYSNPLGNYILYGMPLACGYSYIEEIGMTSIPVAIPRIDGLRALSFANNYIEELDTSVFMYNRGILTLNLRNNSISHIKSTFALYLPHLRVLDLGYNNIHVINPNTFLGVFFDFLSIESNSIQTLSEDILPVFKLCRNIYLTRNPLHCNCELLWLYQWMETLDGEPRVWDAECSSPFGIKLYMARASDFACTPLSLDMRISTDEITYGSDVNITCLGYGDPAPDMNVLGPGGWTKRVQAPQNKTVLHNQVMVQIPSFTCKNVGVYACSATNNFGSSLNYTKLRIIDEACEQDNPSENINMEDHTPLHILQGLAHNKPTFAPKNRLQPSPQPLMGDSEIAAAEIGNKEYVEDLGMAPATKMMIIAVCSIVTGILLLMVILKAIHWHKTRRKRYRLRSEGRMDISFINTAYLTHDEPVVH